MRLHDINFLEIKKISERYISLSHYNNKPIIFNLDNLEVKREIYKKNDKIILDFVYEENIIRLFKLLEKYICEYVYKKNDIKIDINKFIEKTFYSKINNNILSLEIHKNCLFIEEDELSNQKQVNYENIKVGDYCNLKIHLVGINYLEKNYEGIFIVRKVTKQIENDEDINELIIESDTEEDNNIDLENDETITKLILENFEKKEINI